MKEYVVSDGTKETADKMRKFFIDLGVDPLTVYAFAFISRTSNCYWTDEAKEKLYNNRTAPEGFTLKQL